jgi:hypothetical protein
MAHSLLVPCGGCGYENLPQHRFCGMCGFPLPETPADGSRPAEKNADSSRDTDLDEFLAPVASVDRPTSQPAPRSPEPAAQRRPSSAQASVGRNQNFESPAATRREQAPSIVSGPSFLGLAADPSDQDRASYLLDDEDDSSSHGGRFAFVLVLLIVVALSAAVWHWRQEVGVLSARITGRSTQDVSPPADNSAPPVSASPSEVAPAMQPEATTDKPKTGVGDLPANPPQQPLAAPNGQTAPAATNPPASQSPSGPPDSTTPASPAAAANSASGPSDPAAKQDQPPAAQPAAAPQSDDGSSAEKTMREQASVKPTSAARSASRTSAGSGASAATGDSTEAEGEKYLYGTGVPQNCARAQKSLMAAAGRADARAQSVLGTMYATGHCAPRDLPLAYKWFAKALHQDPGNNRLSDDLKVLWNQMTPDERQLALHNQ